MKNFGTSMRTKKTSQIFRFSTRKIAIINKYAETSRDINFVCKLVIEIVERARTPAHAKINGSKIQRMAKFIRTIKFQ